MSHSSHRLRALICSALVCSFSSVAPLTQAAAQQQPAADLKHKTSFNIPAGDLVSALRAFAEASGFQLVYSTEITADAKTSGASGSMSVPEALGRLLAGTGLKYRLVGQKTVSIERDKEGGTRTLGPVRVEGANAQTAGINGSTDPTATEGTRSYTSRALSIASKTPQSIKDTPQSVSVITQQRMQDQNITDFTSLMNQTTGVSVVTQQDGPLAPIFHSRGFLIERLQVDGGAPLDIANSGLYGVMPQLDMAIYDHGEILRGADGLFNGYGGPGGVINLTRKRPLDHPQVILEGQVGSWNNYRTTIDASAPLGFGGRLRGRGVLAYQDQDYFYDTASNNKTVVYGVIEYDLFPTTTLSAGFSSTRQDTVPFQYGLPRYQNGADLALPRDSCLCFPWSREDSDTRDVFARLDQSLGEDWSLKLNLSRTKQERSGKYGYVSGPVNPLTSTGPTMGAVMRDYASEQPLADLVLDGGFELFGQRQRLVVGTNYAKADGGGKKLYSSLSTGKPAVNVAHFDPNDPAYAEPAAGLPTTQYLESGTTQWGAYATLQLTLWEPLQLNLGLRYSHYEYGYIKQSLCSDLAGCTNRGGTRYAPGDVTETSAYRHDTHDLSWPPTWSLVYDLADTLSVYGSYTDIYLEQSTKVDHSGQSLPPITGGNIEGGIKWSDREGRLNATLAIYRLKQEHFPVQLDYGDYAATYGHLPDGIHTCCFSDDADKVYLSEGADLEVTGQLLPDWQLALGYTYNKNEIQGSAAGPDQGKPMASILPQHLFKLWSSYRFQGTDWLRRLSVGGGVNAQSKGYYAGFVCVRFTRDASGNAVCDFANGGSIPYEFTQDFYAVVSARVAYELDSHWSAALNINNLTDRTYYQTVGTSTSGNWYGEPRSFMLTLRGQF